jgi:putative restriction endonuclease
MGVSPIELALRQQIMAALADRVSRNGGVISRKELSAFEVNGQVHRLIDVGKGIWNPRSMDVTLSIVSTPQGPYDDEDVEGGLLRYRYRQGSTAGDNSKLRAAAGTGVPLILLRWIADGVYVPVFPVFIVGDDPSTRSVMVALDESLRFIADVEHPSDDQRRYVERIAKVRLHQPEFRGRVLVAYRRQCSICELKHPELLDAAHIVADGEPLGQPVVVNGLSLCKIHHAAYDQDLVGIDPNFKVHINRSLLEETDGPMLRHGLQEMHGRVLQLPTRTSERPDRERLDMRFARFSAAG